MDRRELDYVDMRDARARAEYINDAPEPAEGEPLPEVCQAVLVVPVPPRMPRGRPRTRQEPDAPKRPYVRVSIRQKAQLDALFSQNGDAKTAEWYASQCGIPLSNTKTLLWKVRKGESLLPKNHYKRKSRVLPFQHLVKRRLAIDPTTSLAVVREDLIQVVAQHGPNVETLPEAVMDEIVQQRAAQPEEAQEAEDQMDDATISEEDPETEVDEEPQEPQEAQVQEQPGIPIPSVSALSRFLRGLTGNGEERTIPVITFKKCHTRGPAANTEDNKTARIEAIQQLRDKFAAGY